MAEKQEESNLSQKERLVRIVDALNPNIDLMERFVALIKKYQMLLSEPKLLFRYRKDWIALRIAFKLYESYKSGQMDQEYAENSIKSIKTYDSALADEVSKLLPRIKENTAIFADLIRAYGRGTSAEKQYFIGYVSTHIEELIRRAKSIKDRGLSQHLLILFSTISGHEVEYLLMYRAECESWASVKFAANSIDYFIKRFDLYLKGGVEYNTKYMGLYRDFGDVKLTSTMLQEPAVRNLWRFREQLRFLNMLIEMCRKSEESGEWEGFYGKNGFWGKKGDQKGKNFDRYSNEFEIKYGHKDFADTLKARKHKIGESPEGWGGSWEGNKLMQPGFLHQLLFKLQNPNYQRIGIIVPASFALIRIFKNREEELMKDREKSVNELIVVLWESTGLGISREKIIKKFGRLLEKRKWKLSKNAENESNQLILKSKSVLIAYDDFSNSQQKAMAKADLDLRMDRMKRLASTAVSNSRYVAIKQKTDEYLNNLRALVRLDGVSGSVAEASLEIKEIMEFKNLNDDDFREMEKLKLPARDVVRNLRYFIISYLRKEINEKFTITIDDVDKLPIETTKPKGTTKPKKLEYGNIAEAA